MRAAAILLLALGAPLAGCGSGGLLPDVPHDLQDGFEDGLGFWEKDADVPPSPDNPGEPVAWSIDEVDEPVYEGHSSARFVLDGRQDDGTIWLERAIEVAPNADLRVTVSGTYWSETESFNTTAVVALYAGAGSPEVELDFDLSGILNEVAGWKTYAHTFDVTAGPDGLLHVGVGLSVVWETWITYYLDDVRVRIEVR